MLGLTGFAIQGRYELVDYLGHGELGDVYRALDLELGRPVAIRLLREDLGSDALFLRRLGREAVLLQTLDHPNIVRHYGLVTQADLTFTVCEFIDGTSLAAVLAGREQPMSLEEAADLLAPVCDALDFSHRQGILHGSLSPGSIFLEREGRVVVGDFGAARWSAPAAAGSLDSSTGSAIYVAPEGLIGQGFTPASDVYSLSAILYQMLTLERPTAGEFGVRLRRESLQSQARRDQPQMPVAVERLILAGLATDPRKRPSTPMELHCELLAAIAQPDWRPEPEPEECAPAAEPGSEPSSDEPAGDTEPPAVQAANDGEESVFSPSSEPAPDGEAQAAAAPGAPPVPPPGAQASSEPPLAADATEAPAPKPDAPPEPQPEPRNPPTRPDVKVIPPEAMEILPPETVPGASRPGKRARSGRRRPSPILMGVLAGLLLSLFVIVLPLMFPIPQELPGVGQPTNGPSPLAALSMTRSAASGTAHPRATGALALLPPSDFFVEYILDASSGMMQPLYDGQSKLDAARSGLAQHWQTLQPVPNAGLRTYGGRAQDTREASCHETRVLAPIGPGELSSLPQLAGDLAARGMSPLSRALSEASADFGPGAGGGRFLVLIASGADNCGEDPCQVVKSHREAGLNYAVYVVGIQVDGDARQSLKCIAETSGGLYRDAGSKEDIARALAQFTEEWR